MRVATDGPAIGFTIHINGCIVLTRNLIPTFTCRCGLSSCSPHRSGWIESPKTGRVLEITERAFAKLPVSLREKFCDGFFSLSGTALFTADELRLLKDAAQPAAGMGLAFGWRRRKGKPSPPAPEPLKPHAEPSTEATEFPIGPGCLRIRNGRPCEDGYSDRQRHRDDWN